MLKIYELILYPWLILAIIIFIVLLQINAPYGKFFNKNFGFSINYKLGWFIQEIVSPISFSFFFFCGPIQKNVITWIFFSIWILHYIYRSIFYPLRMNKNSSEIPIIIMLSAVIFNSINGFTNGFYFSNVNHYDPLYYMNLNFIFGIIVLIIGIYINLTADNILIRLKSKNQGYIIPEGKLYKYISCPNYFGEMLEWLGFAIMTFSLPAFIFFLWTVANLFPRAIATHKWYKKTFDDYPSKRKAILPFII